MDVYKINISQATPIEKENYDGKTPEQLNNAETASIQGITVVEKHIYSTLSPPVMTPSSISRKDLP